GNTQTVMCNFIDSVFKNLFKKKTEERKLISVIEYSENYCFETYYKIETGLCKRTDIITFRDKNISEKQIGELILQHLNLSKRVTEKKVDFTTMYENYKKITKKNSIRKQMKNSKLVQVTLQNNEFTFTPTLNGGTSGDKKGYSEITEKQIKLFDADSETLGKYLLLSLKNCE
ncbi:hypothetical protein, partial [Empedobacter sp. UBA7494]|uniref:hypothetical protein n=1 Tax=Empedobacter sp. UBA7494 TaxID=1946450 RepID=UPI0025C08D13